jgi:hypothetical protein
MIIFTFNSTKALFTLQGRSHGENLTRAMAHPWEANLWTW